jgi:tRNA pseudouridine55 synthase
MMERIKAGFLLINKPAGTSSFDCIRVVQDLMPRGTKIGHTGTLDDFATGLLIVCVGRQATRLASKLLACDKEYIVNAKLGEQSDSLDRTGKIIQTIPDDIVNQITDAQLVAAMHSLQPSYLQVPPIYSALKHQGELLCTLARKQKLPTAVLETIAQQKGRTVFIKEIELVDVQLPFFTIRALVSKGTYVRSLANDIAQKLGLPATTYELERTKINGLDLNYANQLSDIQDRSGLMELLIEVDEMVERLQASDELF